MEEERKEERRANEGEEDSALVFKTIMPQSMTTTLNFKKITMSQSMISTLTYKKLYCPSH